MPTPPTSPELLLQAVEAVQQHGGNISHAAASLGIPRETLGHRYRKAVATYGEQPRRALEGAPPPFQVEQVEEHEEPLSELLERRSAAYLRKQAAQDERNLINVRVNLEGAYGILHLGDPHLDDDGTDLPRLLRYVDLINRTEGLFGANVGDFSNNWVGRLARLYASQGTTAEESLRLVEWFIGAVRWLYLIGGNHDVWSGAQDPVKWFAKQAGLSYQWHGIRLSLQSPNGATVRINARHDFPGTSQWNGAHGPSKAAKMGFEKDHIYTCGHRHSAAAGTLFFNNGEHVAHALRVGAFKMIDDFAASKGFPRENVPAVLTVVNPDARSALGLVTVFWDVDAGVAFLNHLRAPRPSLDLAQRATS